WRDRSATRSCTRTPICGAPRSVGCGSCPRRGTAVIGAPELEGCCADEAASGDELGGGFLVAGFCVGWAFGGDQVPRFGVGVPDVDGDVGRDVVVELGEDAAWVANNTRPVGLALVPRR